MFAWIIAGSLVVGAPGLKEVRKPIDPPSGEWEMRKQEYDGRVQDEYKAGQSEKTMRFTPTKSVLVFFDQFPREQPAAYYINGETLEIDLSPDNPKGMRKGIWTIDGDSLLLCFGERGADRPTDFTAPKDSGRTLWTLKRKPK